MMTWLRNGLLVAVLLGVSPAHAQGLLGEPIVRATGTATVEAAPDYIEFWLRLSRTGATFEEAAAATEGIEDRILEACETLDLAPLDVKASAQAIEDVDNLEVVRTVRLRYAARVMGGADEARRHFAWLCDRNRALATELAGTLEGPFLGVNDRERIEQSALTRAMEGAYPLAQRAASEMNSAVTSVYEADIVSVTWNNDPNWRGPQPEFGRVTCTIEVRMAYTIGNY
jgi:uncharacterized protein YggE